MSWTTAIWSMNAGICLTLAAVHLLVWFKARDSWMNLTFALSSAAASVTAVLEIFLMHSQTTAQYGQIVRWMQVTAAVIVVSLVCFIRLYLRAGRLWLVWLQCVFRALALIINFVHTPNINFREITALRYIPLWGEMVAVPVGVMSPWVYVIRACEVLMFVFVVDATITAWREGRQRPALIIGGTMIIAIIVARMLGVMMVRGNLPIPMTVSGVFFLIVLVMGYELSTDLVRAYHVSQELKLSQERMHLATAAANLGLWEWDIVRDEIWATEKTRARVGLGESESMDLDRYLESLHPDDREPTREVMRHAMECGEEYNAEFRVVGADGMMRQVLACGRVEHDGKGKPLRMRGISMDITERKQAETALKDSEDRLKEAHRMAKLGHWELNLVTNRLIWSDEIFRIFEIDKENFGASYEAFLGAIHPDDRDVVNTAYTQSLETRNPYTITHRLLMRDGRIKYIQEQCQNFYSPEGKPLRSIGTVQDITEHKKSEQALAEAELRYRTVADFTYDWEYWEGPDNEILYMSPSCEFVTGYKNDEFIANPRLLEDIIIPEDKNIWATHIHESQDKNKLIAIQFRILKKDGSIRWIEHACRPVFDENNKYSGYRASNRDITLRKESREALQRSQESLQYFAGKLITAQEEERRRLAREMHDDLTQRMALLAIEVGNLEITSSQHDSPVRAKLQELKKKIIKLSKDIHDISRQIHPAILDDLGLADAIKSECAIFSQREEIDVEYETNNVPSSIPKNVAICIYRITQESLRNIAKHAKANETYVSLIRLDGNLILTVRDNGVGFDTAHGNSQKGIGLTSMKERVRLIDGEFSVQSKPGEGTVIKVIAPYNMEQE